MIAPPAERSRSRSNRPRRSRRLQSLVNPRSMSILPRAGGPRLRLLVHKPTFACTARCPTCDYRRELHQSSRRNPCMTFEQCLDLYRQAAALGTSELHLSGGEPTLYGRLPELVAAGKRLGWFVMLNTNGSQFVREDLVERLFRAGLDGVMVSMYSHQEEVHDAMRQQPGLFRRAMHALEACRRYRQDRNPGFLLVTQSILSRDNLFDSAELLRLVGDAGADVHLFSYVEGDFDARFVPTVDMIRRFRAETVPQLRRSVLGLSLANPVMRAVAAVQVSRLFSQKRNSDENYAACIYQDGSSNSHRCTIPDEFMLVLPDGNVHPCNVVEYSHEPVVGNLLQEGGNLEQIWEGDRWNRFRRERHDWCRRCPMTCHTWVPLNLTFRRLGRLLARRV
jgi:radical SAM protein with 4Fe4S-binding SPASM domain